MSNPANLFLLLNGEEIELLPVKPGGSEYRLAGRKPVGSADSLEAFMQKIQQGGIGLRIPPDTAATTLAVELVPPELDSVLFPLPDPKTVGVHLWAEDGRLTLSSNDPTASSFTMGCSAVWPAKADAKVINRIPLSGVYLKIYKNEGPAVS